MPGRDLAPDWTRMLRAEAAAYAGVALVNIAREFPVMDFYVWNGPDDVPGLPRDATPVFYGSFDWHSCVEMHWLLVRLLRVAGDAVPASAIKTLLNQQFSAAGLAAEAVAVAGRTGAGQRPYGWGVGRCRAGGGPQHPPPRGAARAPGGGGGRAGGAVAGRGAAPGGGRRRGGG